MAKQSWRLVAAIVALLGLVTMEWAETEVEPGAVSEGLKAIFKYGNGTKETADRLNANTVTVMTGTIAGTYVQFGADLASALDDGDTDRPAEQCVGGGDARSGRLAAVEAAAAVRLSDRPDR